MASEEAVTKLMFRFEGCSRKDAADALKKTSGHAGKAARQLRAKYSESSQVTIPVSDSTSAAEPTPKAPSPAIRASTPPRREPHEPTDAPVAQRSPAAAAAAADPALVALAARFDACPITAAADAMKKAGGHAGKAARQLRKQFTEVVAPVNSATPGSPPRTSTPPRRGLKAAVEADMAEAVNSLPVPTAPTAAQVPTSTASVPAPEQAPTLQARSSTPPRKAPEPTCLIFFEFRNCSGGST